MITREDLERREFAVLSACGTKAAESRGRVLPEEQCSSADGLSKGTGTGSSIRKPFGRLMHKTQVFISPEGDHFRTRLTHTIEVSQIARTIARGAGLNEDLAEAIAMGHDLGHTPFGHSGEAVLNEIYSGGFHHNEQSLRVVDVLESGEQLPQRHESDLRGAGTVFYATRARLLPVTPEGQVVRVSDRIAIHQSRYR